MFNKTVLRLVLGIVLLPVLGFCDSAPSPWKLLSYPEFGISVQSPVSFRDASATGDELKKLKEVGVVKQMAYAGEDGKGLAIVITGAMGPGNMEKAELTSAADSFASSLKTNFPLIQHQNKKFLYQGFPAIWTTGNLDGDKNTYKLLCLSVAKDRWLWMIAVLYPNTPGYEAVAKAVTASAKLKVPNP